MMRSVPSRTTAGEMARAFRALSDPSRIRLLGALVRAPLCPCLLQRLEPMKNSVLSYHLRILKGAGLVTPSATSHFRIYKATERGREAVSFLRGALATRSSRGSRPSVAPAARQAVPPGTR